MTTNTSAAETLSGVQVLHATRFKPQEVRWLWPGWLAKGKFHVLTGAPGSGKTTMALGMAALVSAGGFWPDTTGEGGGGGSIRGEQGDVLIWCGEDAISDTLLPRLLAAGAKPERIHFVTGGLAWRHARPFRPAVDLAALAAAASALPGLRLIVLDAVAPAAGRPSTTTADAEEAPRSLAELAARLDCAVLGIARGGETAARVAASNAYGAVPRIVLATVKGGRGEASRLVRAKSSLGPEEGGVEYRLTLAAVPGQRFEALRAMWGELIDASPQELLKPEKPEAEQERAELRDSERFLVELLGEGPLAVTEVRDESYDSRTCWRTVQRAKVRLGIRTVRRQDDQVWTWALPAHAPSPPAASLSSSSSLSSPA